MKLLLTEALEINERYSQVEAPLFFMKDNYIYDGETIIHISKGAKFESTQAALFKKSKVEELNFVYNDKLAMKLYLHFPTKYRLPVRKLDLNDKENVIAFDKLLDKLAIAESYTKKKRYIIPCIELYKKEKQDKEEDYEYEILLEYGEMINKKKWHEIKQEVLNQSTKIIPYRFNDSGIIIFQLTSSDERKNNLKQQLHFLILDSKKNNVLISPDFLAMQDTFIVSSEEEFLTVYNECNINLVIIPDEINENYQKVINKVKSIDKFVKIISIPNIVAGKERELLLLIKKAYEFNLWEIQKDSERPSFFL